MICYLLLPGDLQNLRFFLNNKSPYANWTVLDLGNCHICDDGLSILCQAITHGNVNTHLETINLSCNLLTLKSSEDLSIICCLSKNIYITNNCLENGLAITSSYACLLNISYNNISPTGAVNLFSSLLLNKSLAVLYVDNICIRNEAVDELAVFLQENHILEELHMSRNNLSSCVASKMLGEEL